ncbi:hypothetical protein, partial [Archangium sp.]|uniref:hypothetical protein n=1 Tax=Archangium sp. TaxID=1872627 RepID=UPI002EDA33D2
MTKQQSDELQKKIDADFQQLALSPPDQPESRLNLTTLVTTVDIPSESNCDFETLASTLDPRSWKNSPFWPESHRVLRSPDGRELTPFAKTDDPPLGIGWKGLFFEHVRMNLNTATVASFRNFLNIEFEVDPA